MNMQPSNKLLVMVGPTAVGKTSLAILIAKQLNAEIISADSQLFYNELNIGVAKPTEEERNIVPHHLIDVTDLSHPWSIAIFKQSVYRLIEKISSRGKLPLLVGGSGQYIKSVVENWTIPEFDKDETLRIAITQWGKEIGALQLYEKLKIVDPEAAKNIEYRNMRRTIRALEVIFSSGQLFSKQRARQETPFNVTIVGLILPRNQLYERIDCRIKSMINGGWIQEVQGLIDSGYQDLLLKSAPIGYLEITRYLIGEISLSEAIVLIKRKTRILVRRQANWFKPNDPKIKWFLNIEKNFEEIISYFRESM